MTATQPMEGRPLGPTDRLRAKTPSLIPALWIGLIIVGAVATGMAHPEWWTWIAPEASLAREINTAMLLATAGLASLIWWWDRGVGKSFRDGAPMATLAVGFVALAADERVAIHERLRDRVLAPRDITLPFVPWGEPGDIVLVVVAVFGLIGLRWVLGRFADNRRARGWFLAGVVLAALAVGLDTLPIETYQLRFEIYFQSFEEVVELAAAACFLSSLLTLVAQPSPVIARSSAS